MASSATRERSAQLSDASSREGRVGVLSNPARVAGLLCGFRDEVYPRLVLHDLRSSWLHCASPSPHLSAGVSEKRMNGNTNDATQSNNVSRKIKNIILNIVFNIRLDFQWLAGRGIQTNESHANVPVVLYFSKNNLFL